MSDIVERLRRHDGHLGLLVEEAADEIERLLALLHRWVIWNGEDRHHDLLDETRRALEGK